MRRSAANFSSEPRNGPVTGHRQVCIRISLQGMRRRPGVSIQAPFSPSGGRPEGAAMRRPWVADEQNDEMSPAEFRRAEFGACRANIQVRQAQRQEIRIGPVRARRKRIDPGTTAWQPGNRHSPEHPRHEMRQAQEPGTCAKTAARRGHCCQNIYAAVDSVRPPTRASMESISIR